MNPQDSEMHTIGNPGSTEGESSSARKSDSKSSRKQRAGKGTTSWRAGTCPWIFTILALDGTNTTGRETLEMVGKSDWNLKKGATNWPTLWEMRDLTTDEGHPSFKGDGPTTIDAPGHVWIGGCKSGTRKWKELSVKNVGVGRRAGNRIKYPHGRSRFYSGHLRTWKTPPDANTSPLLPGCGKLNHHNRACMVQN